MGNVSGGKNRLIERKKIVSLCSSETLALKRVRKVERRSLRHVVVSSCSHDREAQCVVNMKLCIMR